MNPEMKRIEWSTSIQSTDGQQSQPDFLISKGQDDNAIRVHKNMYDTGTSKYLFTFNLKGDVPAQARQKGFKGENWNMFLYVNGPFNSECFLPAFKPEIESIICQQVMSY